MSVLNKALPLNQMHGDILAKTGVVTALQSIGMDWINIDMSWNELINEISSVTSFYMTKIEGMEERISVPVLAIREYIDKVGVDITHQMLYVTLRDAGEIGQNEVIPELNKDMMDFAYSEIVKIGAMDIVNNLLNGNLTKTSDVVITPKDWELVNTSNLLMTNIATEGIAYSDITMQKMDGLVDDLSGYIKQKVKLYPGEYELATMFTQLPTNNIGVVMSIEEEDGTVIGQLRNEDISLHEQASLTFTLNKAMFVVVKLGMNIDESVIVTGGPIISFNRAMIWHKVHGLSLALIEYFNNNELPRPSKYRYVRDTMNGCSIDNGAWWTEIEVNNSRGRLVSAGKPVTPSVPSGGSNGTEDAGRVTDGNYLDPFYVTVGEAHVTVDLEDWIDINTIAVMHRKEHGTKIFNHKIDVSDDGIVWEEWKPVGDTDEFIRPNIFVRGSAEPINGVRYIRDWAKGSSANTGNHWVEITALDKDGVSLSQGKTVTSNSATASDRPTSWITDGSVNTDQYCEPTTKLADGSAWMGVDLGAVLDVKNVKIHHYFHDLRTYYGTKTEVSMDGVEWFTIFDSEIEGTYPESSAGRTHIVDLNSILPNLINNPRLTDTAGEGIPDEWRLVQTGNMASTSVAGNGNADANKITLVNNPTDKIGTVTLDYTNPDADHSGVTEAFEGLDWEYAVGAGTDGTDALSSPTLGDGESSTVIYDFIYKTGSSVSLNIEADTGDSGDSAVIEVIDTNGLVAATHTVTELGQSAFVHNFEANGNGKLKVTYNRVATATDDATQKVYIDDVVFADISVPASNGPDDLVSSYIETDINALPNGEYTFCMKVEDLLGETGFNISIVDSTGVVIASERCDTIGSANHLTFVKTEDAGHKLTIRIGIATDLPRLSIVSPIRYTFSQPYLYDGRMITNNDRFLDNNV